MTNTNKVILDVDTGEDDLLAIQIAIALKLPVERVVTSHGNTTLEKTTKNTARLLNFLNAHQVKVIQGSAKPLSDNPLGIQEDAMELTGPDGICGLEMPENDHIEVVGFSSNKKFLTDIDVYFSTEGPVDYIVTGPMTNLAKLCVYFGRSISDHIGRVFIMGGALDRPGNTGPKVSDLQGAEFNVYCDPLAAYIVNSSGLQQHWVTWDTTHQMTISRDSYEKFEPNGPSAELTYKLMGKFFDDYGTKAGREFEFNDPLTVMAQQGFGSFVPEMIEIKLEPSEYGYTRRSQLGNPIEFFSIGESEQKELVGEMLRILGLIPS